MGMHVVLCVLQVCMHLYLLSCCIRLHRIRLTSVNIAKIVCLNAGAECRHSAHVKRIKEHELDFSYMQLSHLVFDQTLGPSRVALPVDSQHQAEFTKPCLSRCTKNQ